MGKSTTMSQQSRSNRGSRPGATQWGEDGEATQGGEVGGGRGKR